MLYSHPRNHRTGKERYASNPGRLQRRSHLQPGLEPDQATLSIAAARAILDLDFRQSDKDRMCEFSAKAREGTLTTDEHAAINNYERFGHTLSSMKSKARLSLNDLDTANRKAKIH